MKFTRWFAIAIITLFSLTIITGVSKAAGFEKGSLAAETATATPTAAPIPTDVPNVHATGGADSA